MKTTRTLLSLLLGLALIAIGPGCSKSDDDAKDKAERKERRKERRRSRLDKAKAESAKTLVRNVTGKVVSYALVRVELPQSLDRLVDGKYVHPKQLVDPWRAGLAYDRGSSGEPTDFSLCSNGPDGEAGSEDDICMKGIDW